MPGTTGRPKKLMPESGNACLKACELLSGDGAQSRLQVRVGRAGFLGQCGLLLARPRVRLTAERTQALRSIHRVAGAIYFKAYIDSSQIALPSIYSLSSSKMREIDHP